MVVTAASADDDLTVVGVGVAGAGGIGSGCRQQGDDGQYEFHVGLRYFQKWKGLRLGLAGCRPKRVSRAVTAASRASISTRLAVSSLR